jgi:hypothetical protein
MCEITRNVADGTALSLHVEQRNVAFGRGVELEDLRNAEAVFEGIPDIGSQSIPARKADTMMRFICRWTGMQQVPAEFADVLKQRAVPANDLVPELARRKLFAYDNRASCNQHGPHRLHAANAVIHGEAIVHPVDGLDVHHAGEPVTPLHQTRVGDPRSLGQAGGSGCVNVESEILDRC